MDIFKENEQRPQGTCIDSESMLMAVKFNSDGLIPAIAQQYNSGEVLMLAWMNAEALRETLTSGRVCYWSRSRKSLWRKGESSGQVQLLKSASLDCDGDTLLLQVDQTGPACHTGRRHCFFYKIEPEAHNVRIEGNILIAPDQLYKQ